MTLRAILTEIQRLYGPVEQRMANLWVQVMRDFSDIWTLFVNIYRRTQGNLFDILRNTLVRIRNVLERWYEQGWFHKIARFLAQLTEWVQPLLNWFVDNLEPLAAGVFDLSLIHI